MSVFLLVHGAWHGAWCWKRLEGSLQRRGHEPLSITLTGLADRSHLFSPEIGLSTHIDDVVSAAKWAELDDFVLCGHSYGGMVISGAAEMLEERLRGIIFMDAFFPQGLREPVGIDRPTKSRAAFLRTGTIPNRTTE